METLYHNFTGFVHLYSSLIAVVSGTVVLVFRKGTKQHKVFGYIYATNMTVLLVTAFMIYRLFGGFGLFHVAGILGSITLLGGMIPVLRRKPGNWVFIHFTWMYWSVFGLYAALVSELMTRIPSTPFFGMIGFATGAMLLLGAFIFRRKKKQWTLEFKGRR